MYKYCYYYLSLTIKIFILIILLFNISFCSNFFVKSKKDNFLENHITYINVKDIILNSNDKAYHPSDTFSYLLEKIIYQIYGNTVITEVHQVVRILKDNYPVDLNTKVLYYKSIYQQITNILAYTISPGGKKTYITNIKPNKAFSNKNIKSSLYKDIFFYKINFPNLKKGSIISLRYKLKTMYFGFPPHISGVFHLKKPFSVLNQKTFIIVPKNQKIYFKNINTNHKFTKINYKNTDYYILTNPLNKDLLYSKSRSLLNINTPRIFFSSLSNWEGINEQLHRFFAFRPNNTLEFINHVKTKVNKTNTKIEKIKKIYNYITKTKNIDNIPIAFGIDGYIPNDPHVIYKYKYADSKDKVMLFMSMLKIIGIDSYATFLNDNYNFEYDVPSLNVFNRVVVAVPIGGSGNAKYKFLDPYAAIMFYDNLPENYYGKNVLIVKEDGPEFTKIPMIKASENKLVYMTKSSLDSNGDLQYSTKLESYGSYEVKQRFDMIKVMLRDKSLSLYENYKNLYQNHKLELIKFESGDPFDIDKPYSYTSEFKLKNFADFKKNTLSFPLELYNLSFNSIFNSTNDDIYFNLPFTILSKNDIYIPKNFVILKIPDLIDIKTSDLIYKRFLSIKGDLIQCNRVFQIRNRLINKKNYENFIIFIKKISALEKEKVLIQKRISK